MGRLLRALRSIRAPHLWAVGLLALAAAASCARRAPWLPGPDFLSRPDDLMDLPRDLFAWACFAAAPLLALRRTRAAGLVVGLSAAAAATTHATSGRLWSRCGPFGEAPAFALPWALAVSTLIVLVPVERRRTAPGAVASWTATIGGGVLLWLAFVKLPTLYETKCDNRWLDEDVAMTGAELWTGLLALAPATRLVGTSAGALLMSGAAAFAFRQSELGTPWRGCHCFGSVDAPWHVHFVFAVLLAAVLATAALLAVPRLFAARAAGPATSLLDEARAAATRSERRFAWAPRVGATLVAVLAGSRLLQAGLLCAEAAGDAARYARPPSEAAFGALLGVQGMVAARLLLLRRRRAAGAFLGALSATLELVSYEFHAGWFGWPMLPVWLPLAALGACVLAARSAFRRDAAATRLESI